jgi:hypothetical protein
LLDRFQDLGMTAPDWNLSWGVSPKTNKYVVEIMSTLPNDKRHFPGYGASFEEACIELGDKFEKQWQALQEDGL